MDGKNVIHEKNYQEMVSKVRKGRLNRSLLAGCPERDENSTPEITCDLNARRN